MNQNYSEWGPAHTRHAHADTSADRTRAYDSMPAPELVSAGHADTREFALVPSTSAVLPEDN